MFSPPSNQQVVGTVSGVPSAQVAPPPPPANTQQQSTTTTNLNNPFLDPTNNQVAAAYQIPTVAAAVPAQSAMTNGAVQSVASSNPPHVAQQLHISTEPSADDLECFIPGCGKPVHVDAKGMKTSDYCSMRHRECENLFILCLYISLKSFYFLLFFWW